MIGRAVGKSNVDGFQEVGSSLYDEFLWLLGHLVREETQRGWHRGEAADIGHYETA